MNFSTVLSRRGRRALDHASLSPETPSLPRLRRSCYWCNTCMNMARSETRPLFAPHSISVSFFAHTTLSGSVFCRKKTHERAPTPTHPLVPSARFIIPDVMTSEPFSPITDVNYIFGQLLNTSFWGVQSMPIGSSPPTFDP